MDDIIEPVVNSIRIRLGGEVYTMQEARIGKIKKFILTLIKNFPKDKNPIDLVSYYVNGFFEMYYMFINIPAEVMDNLFVSEAVALADCFLDLNMHKILCIAKKFGLNVNVEEVEKKMKMEVNSSVQAIKT